MALGAFGTCLQSARAMRSFHKSGHRSKLGDVAGRRLRHRGHICLRSGIGLHVVLALGGIAAYILTDEQHFGKTSRLVLRRRGGDHHTEPGPHHAERRRYRLEEPVGQAVGKSLDHPAGELVTVAADDKPGPERRPAHRRRWHGRVPGHRAPRARRGRDTGRRRRHRLPQNRHPARTRTQQPVT